MKSKQKDMLFPPNTRIDESAIMGENIYIGDYVIIAAGVIIGSNVKIRDHVSIGAGAIINDDIYIEPYSIIGPGAMIDMNVGSKMIMQGNPARCIGMVNPKSESKVKRYAIPADQAFTYCKAQECGKQIFWIITDAGKRMPVDPDGIPHFATCPAANKFRKKK